MDIHSKVGLNLGSPQPARASAFNGHGHLTKHATHQRIFLEYASMLVGVFTRSNGLGEVPQGYHGSSDFVRYLANVSMCCLADFFCLHATFNVWIHCGHRCLGLDVGQLYGRYQPQRVRSQRSFCSLACFFFPFPCDEHTVGTRRCVGITSFHSFRVCTHGMPACERGSIEESYSYVPLQTNARRLLAVDAVAASCSVRSRLLARMDVTSSIVLGVK